MATASRPRQREDLELAALTVDQASVVLGVSRPTVYKLIREARLRSITVGRRRLIPQTSIDELLRDPSG